MAAPGLDQLEQLDTENKSAALKERKSLRNFADQWNNRQKSTETQVSEGETQTDATKTVDNPVENVSKEPAKVEQEKSPMAKALSKNNEEKGEKKPRFVDTKIKEAEEAKRVAQEAQEKLKAFETEKATYETQIAELKKQIEGTDSKSKTAELEAKLQQVEKLNSDLVNEKTELKGKLDLVDGIKSETFQTTYVAPVAEKYNALCTIVNNDPSLLVEIEKIRQASDAAFSAQTPEERLRQETIRDEIANSIYESLPPVKQARFNDLYYGFLSKNQDLQVALSKGNETVQKLREQETRARMETETKTKGAWKQAFDSAKAQLEETYKYSPEVEKTIQLKKIDDSVDGDLEIAQDLIQFGTKFPQSEYSRVIAQGALVPRLNASNKAKDIIIGELQETINKLRGSTTEGRASQLGNPPPANGVGEDGKSTDGKVRTKNDFLSRWGSHRMNR